MQLSSRQLSKAVEYQIIEQPKNRGKLCNMDPLRKNTVLCVVYNTFSVVLKKSNQEVAAYG